MNHQALQMIQADGPGSDDCAAEFFTRHNENLIGAVLVGAFPVARVTPARFIKTRPQPVNPDLESLEGEKEEGAGVSSVLKVDKQP